MAIHAGHAARFVRATLPEQVRAPRVALLARLILFGNRIRGVLSEADRDGVLTAPRFHVRTPRPVPRFAAMRLIGSSRMRHGPAHWRVFKPPVLVLVARDAGLASDIVAIRGSRGGFSPFLASRRIRCVLDRRPRIQANGESKRDKK